jgi:hypothetical protein
LIFSSFLGSAVCLQTVWVVYFDVTILKVDTQMPHSSVIFIQGTCGIAFALVIMSTFYWIHSGLYFYASWSCSHVDPTIINKRVGQKLYTCTQYELNTKCV